MQRWAYEKPRSGVSLIIELDAPSVRVTCGHCGKYEVSYARTPPEAETLARLVAARHEHRPARSAVPGLEVAIVDVARLVCSDCLERECQCLMPHGEWPAAARAAYIAEPRPPAPRAHEGLIMSSARTQLFQYLPPAALGPYI